MALHVQLENKSKIQCCLHYLKRAAVVQIPFKEFVYQRNLGRQRSGCDRNPLSKRSYLRNLQRETLKKKHKQIQQTRLTTAALPFGELLDARSGTDK
jgi:hypothetical protein